MLFCQAFYLCQIQLALLAPPFLTRSYSGAKLLIQMVAMLSNVLWLVAVSKCLECSLGILKHKQRITRRLQGV